MAREIPLTRGMVAVVDDQDYDELSKFRWFAKCGRWTWYAERNTPRDENGRRSTVRMHRQILGVIGDIEVDHRNGDGLDNRRANLRTATAQENQRNRTHKPAGSSSRFHGVRWHAKSGKWEARIADGERTANGCAKNRFLGHFASETEAALAYDAAARVSFGDFASLNFPDMAVGQ